MSRRTRSLAAVPLALLLAAGGLGAPASAAPKPGPGTIPLVTGSMPEGISAGPGLTFFAGARSDGAVYVGNTRNGKLRTLVRGEPGEVAVGLLYDEATKRLWVAGGSTGDVTAYDARSGRELFTVNIGPGTSPGTSPRSRFLNDVAITPDAVYVTDSTRPELIVIPTPGGRLPAPGTATVLPLTGDYVQPSGFGANGIRALPDGDLLLVSGGRLYTVTTAGVTDLVEVTGGALTAGDGLVLSGSTLYVVNGFGGNEVVVLRLADDAGSATVTGVLTAPELDRPTTGALVGGSLYVVNGRFGTLPRDPDAPVFVTRLPQG
jgi:sugar lactone lactonase YvrE